jgi:general stress protein YciG
MTSQSPRIYTYKITFEEVPYYYYGSHKEKQFDEKYWGTPVTHKWCWELYTPKKQILELFDYTDEGWLEANEVEKRIIKQFYNADRWCLNENCGGNFSIKHQQKAGRKSGLSHKQNGTGFFKLTKEERSELSKKCGKKGGTKTKELGVGIFSIPPDKKSETSHKTGKKVKELGIGIFSRTPEKISEDCKKGGSKTYIESTGVFSITPEERKEINKRTNSQKWMCLETGYITTAGPLSNYQKARGIDTSKRKRIS